jgi:hypothetical protein
MACAVIMPRRRRCRGCAGYAEDGSRRDAIVAEIHIAAPPQRARYRCEFSGCQLTQLRVFGYG